VCTDVRLDGFGVDTTVDQFNVSLNGATRVPGPLRRALRPPVSAANDEHENRPSGTRAGAELAYHSDMYRFGKRQAVFIWAAMLAVLFGALAPAIAHTTSHTTSHTMAASGQPAPQVQICTMKGMRTVLVDGAAPADSGSPDAAHSFEHCPYCVSQGGVALLPQGGVLLFSLQSSPASYPLLVHQATTASNPWTHASPRAPPALG